MSDEQDSRLLEDQRFQALLIECLERLERGEPLEPEELISQHPEFAKELAEFLDNHDSLEKMVGKLRTSWSGVKGSGVLNPEDETIDSRPDGNGFLPGDRLRYVGHYEILEEIARGGMGVVYKARQQGLLRIVALKMILAGQLADPAEVKRFQREARVAAQLQHPNIVAVHEVGEHEGHHYFTMDFVEGQTLASRLRDGSLPPSQAAELVKTVAEAVHYAHQQGALHRDLKPANVLLDAAGEPHITDFGLAKFTTGERHASRSELTGTGQVLGTPSYMSPEQAAGKQNLVGTASDIFSLGAILYACLTGRAPFVADTPIDTLMQVLHKEPIALRLLNPGVPKDLETICLKCLQKEPHKRYGTAGQLAEDLARFLSGRPVLARPVGPVDAAWRWCRRNPLGAAVVLLVLLLAVAGPIVAVRESLLRQLASESAQKATEAGEREAAARQDVQRRLYNSDINGVQRAHEIADADRMREILQRHIPQAAEKDQRTFEWFYWWQRCHDDRLVLQHPGRVTAVTFSPDGQTLATGCTDGLVRLWSVATGEPTGVLGGRAQGAVRLAFTPEGTSIVTLDDEGVVNVWDTRLLTLRRSWTSGDKFGLALSPDGTKLATGGMKGGVTIWEVASGEQVDFLEMKDVVVVTAIAYSPDGTRLAAIGDLDDSRPSSFHVVVWDLGTREATVPAPPPLTAMAEALAFSPDSKHLAVGEWHQHLVFYDTSNYQFESIESGHWQRVEAVAYSPSGKLLASGGGRDRVVRLWDTHTKRLKRTLVGHRDGVTDIAFSPSGDSLATASFDNTVRLWNVNDPKTDKQITLEGQLVSVPLSQGRGALIAASEAGENALTWTPSGATLSLDLGDARPVCISKAGWLVVQERMEPPPDVRKDSYQMRLVDFMRSRSEVVLNESHDKSGVCAFAPDASALAVASGNAVKLVSLPDGQPVADCQVHEQPVLSLTFSDDGRLIVSSGLDRVIKVWDRKAGRLLATLGGYSSEAAAVGIHPDATLLASGHDDNAIRLWNVDTGELVTTLTGHSEWITALAFSPDGQTLASLSRDGRLCLWDPTMRELRSTLEAHAETESNQLVWTPDSRTLAVPCEYDNLQIWQAALDSSH